MNKYHKRMRDGSIPYRAGRAGRPLHQSKAYIPPDLVDFAPKEYARGKRDRAKLKRKHRRDEAIGNVFIGFLAFFGILIGYIGLAIAWALPWAFLAVIVKLLFFGGF